MLDVMHIFVWEFRVSIKSRKGEITGCYKELLMNMVAAAGSYKNKREDTGKEALNNNTACYYNERY